jgi:hypothetical protein
MGTALDLDFDLHVTFVFAHQKVFEAVIGQKLLQMRGDGRKLGITLDVGQFDGEGLSVV